MKLWIAAAGLAACLFACSTEEAVVESVEQELKGLCQAVRLQSDDDFVGEWEGTDDDPWCCHPTQSGRLCVSCDYNRWACWFVN